MRILAIETSCDETAVAIVKDGNKVEISLVSSQADLHRPFGGVVPEVASRAHQEWLPLLVRQALDKTGYGPGDFDAVAATRGPGLVGALLVGVSFAKALALSWEVPWVGVNHLEGHLASLELADPAFEPPFVALLVSGGHTEYVAVTEGWEISFLGGTLDDAAGEAFDKVAHLLGLGYPGGPAIENAAADYKGVELFDFPIPMKAHVGCDISFSGLKTAVAMALDGVGGGGNGATASYWAASFQSCAVRGLVAKLQAAVQSAGGNRVALCGGVAANQALRSETAELTDRRGWELGVCPLEYCGDNAAMIGAAAFGVLQREGESSFELDADPRLSLVKIDGN